MKQIQSRVCPGVKAGCTPETLPPEAGPRGQRAWTGAAGTITADLRPGLPGLRCRLPSAGSLQPPRFPAEQPEALRPAAVPHRMPPGAAAPPPAASASPGGAAASAPAGARQLATQGTKATARHAGTGLPRREGRAQGRGVPDRQPSAWPARHPPPAPVTAPAGAGGPCCHAPCRSRALIGHASYRPASGGRRVRHFLQLPLWLSQPGRRRCSWLSLTGLNPDPRR